MMKKIFLLAAFLFQLTICIGQGTNWGPWTQHACFKGLQTRAKVRDYNNSAKQYDWDVEIKNNYSMKVSFNYDIENSSIDGRTTMKPGETGKSWTLNPSNSGLIIEFSKVCFHHPSGFDQCAEYDQKGYASFADCDNGSPNYQVYNGTSKGSSNTSSSNTTSTNQTRRVQEAEENKRLTEGTKTYFEYYNRATSAGQAGNYDEAISNWNSAISVAVNDAQRENAQAWLAEVQKAKANSSAQTKNAEVQRQQQLLKQQQEEQRQQQLQQGVNQITTATVDLVTYFANRKNALRNSLSKEDGQALIDIANSESPTNYTDNIIQIFTGLGYTLRKTERKDNMVMIFLNNDVANVNDFMLISIYNNSISFDYHRKNKLLEQLSVISDKLKNFTLYGISPTNQQKKIVQDKKQFNEKTKSALTDIENFEKENYWNRTDYAVFISATSIAEAYEDENVLNNKAGAIRYYRKAASVTLEELTFVKGDNKLRAIQQEKLAKVYFKLAYLLDEDGGDNGKEAILWYKKSAEVYKETPYKNIAFIYKLGKGGVPVDWNESKNYFEMAAEENDGKAMYNLGKLYESGGPNLDKDESKSKKWYKKACKADKKYCN